MRGTARWSGNTRSAIRARSRTTGFDCLPNGNTAILIWENKTYDEALAKGRDPKDKALSRNGMPAPGQGPDGQPLQGIWPDAILEVTPKGEIAWEWHVWDNIGTGPDQIDINWHLPLSMGYFARADWTHWNSVRYNAKTDQYAVNSRDFGEIYIIDRKTKKIVWRYGNPATHGMGKAPSGYHDDGDQVLFGSHDVEWLPNGNISIFNNGTHRPSANRSSVMEINPATNQVVWQYETKDHNSFYSDFQSAAQKLPNGNWFITSTNNGHLFEVTPDKQVVWEYNNPISTDDQAYCVKRDDKPETQVHRAYRYGKDFPAFAGKDLKPQGKLAAGCPDWHLLLEFRQGPNFSSK